IAEIFARDGEAFFRQAEARVIGRLLSGDPMVLATGGGAFMSDTVRRVVKAAAISLFLDATLDTLWDRVKHSKTRPLLQTDAPRDTLQRLLDKRRPTYLTADIVVETRREYSVRDTTDRVLLALQTAGVIKDIP
ncbi:MAG: shikimate kinase, partial [Pseudomonadota bacterium]